jgi:hypothetical protein
VAGYQLLSPGVLIDVTHQQYVQLHEVGRELENVTEAGEARADVVDRELEGWAQSRKCPSHWPVVFDDDMLGQLQHDRPVRSGRQAEPRVP